MTAVKVSTASVCSHAGDACASHCAAACGLCVAQQKAVLTRQVSNELCVDVFLESCSDVAGACQKAISAWPCSCGLSAVRQKTAV